MKKISLNKMTALIIYMVLSIILFCAVKLISPMALDSWSGYFSILSILLLCSTIFAIKQSGMAFLSVFSLIALMSYLFQFGSIFCYSLGYEVDKLQARMEYYLINEAAFKSGCEISLGCIIALTMGGLIENLSAKNGNIKYLKSGLDVNIHFYKVLGIIILLISAPFWIYTLAYSVQTIISGGSYTVLASASLPGYITSLGKFVYVGLMMMIFYYHKIQSKFVKWLWIFAFLGMLGMIMILGSRSEPITIMFAFLIFCNRCIDFQFQFRFRQVVILTIGIYLLLDVLYAIQISRNNGFNFSDIFTNFFTAGPKVIINEIFEFGGTEYSTASVINRIEEFHPSWFFIKELSSITPIPIQSEYTIVASVAAGTPELGTSFIGEMYYYFGHLCYVACFCIAIYLVKIEKWIYKQIDKKNYYIFFMFLMWMWQEINCIRASFNLSIKTMVYSFVLFEISRMIYYTIYRKKRFKVIYDDEKEPIYL